MTQEHPDIEVYIDSREQKPYNFNMFSNVNTETLKLQTGDYCLQTDGVKMGEKSFDPDFAIERKASSDFLQSITTSRDRFEKELERATSFVSRMPIIVSSPWAYFSSGQYYSDIHPNSVSGTVESHVEFYNVDYWFRRNKKKARKLCYEFLVERHQTLMEEQG